MPGHIGVSWWQTSRGNWHCAASALGKKPHSADVKGNSQAAKKKAIELLKKAIKEIE